MTWLPAKCLGPTGMCQRVEQAIHKIHLQDLDLCERCLGFPRKRDKERRAPWAQQWSTSENNTPRSADKPLSEDTPLTDCRHQNKHHRMQSYKQSADTPQTECKHTRDNAHTPHSVTGPSWARGSGQEIRKRTDWLMEQEVLLKGAIISNHSWERKVDGRGKTIFNGLEGKQAEWEAYVTAGKGSGLLSRRKGQGWDRLWHNHGNC